MEENGKGSEEVKAIMGELESLDFKREEETEKEEGKSLVKLLIKNWRRRGCRRNNGVVRYSAVSKKHCFHV